MRSLSSLLALLSSHVFTLGNVLGAASRKTDKQPPLKKKRIDTTGDWTTSDGLDFDLEVYGQTDLAPTTHRSEEKLILPFAAKL